MNVCFGFHEIHGTQEKLAAQDRLAVTQEKLAPTIHGMESIHQRIFRLRVAAGLSVTALAEMLHVSRRTVELWEGRGVSEPTAPKLDRIPALASVLNVTPAYLAFGDVSPLSDADSTLYVQSSAETEHRKIKLIDGAVKALLESHGYTLEGWLSTTTLRSGEFPPGASHEALNFMTQPQQESAEDLLKNDRLDAGPRVKTPGSST